MHSLSEEWVKREIPPTLSYRPPVDHHKGFTGVIEVALCQAVHLPRNQVADILIRICRCPQRKLALDSLKIVFALRYKSTKNI